MVFVDEMNEIVIDDGTKAVMKEEQEAPKKKKTTTKEKEWIAPTSLDTIEKRIAMLIDDLPSMEDTKALSLTNPDGLESWCRQMYKVKDRFDLLKDFISPAVYKWQTEHTGISQQNVAFLITEMHKTLNTLLFVQYVCKKN